MINKIIISFSCAFMNEYHFWFILTIDQFENNALNFISINVTSFCFLTLMYVQSKKFCMDNFENNNNKKNIETNIYPY